MSCERFEIALDRFPDHRQGFLARRTLTDTARQRRNGDAVPAPILPSQHNLILARRHKSSLDASPVASARRGELSPSRQEEGSMPKQIYFFAATLVGAPGVRRTIAARGDQTRLTYTLRSSAHSNGTTIISIHSGWTASSGPAQATSTRILGKPPAWSARRRVRARPGASERRGPAGITSGIARGENGEKVAPASPPPKTETPDYPGALRERMMGLEPTTFCMASRRSSQLSYIRAAGPV